MPVRQAECCCEIYDRCATAEIRNATLFGVNASGDFLRAAICSGLCRPGAPAYPFACAEICGLQMMRPELAR